MILYYVRHGDPIYVPDQLTPLGMRQAEAVAKRLSLHGIDEIYASSSTRAMQTAQPTAEYNKLEVKLLDWIHESLAYKEMSLPLGQNQTRWCWSHPQYANLFASKEIRDLGDRWYEHPVLQPLKLERCPKRVGGEMDQWMASLGLEHDREKGLYRVTKDIREKRVAFFAHEGVGKVFLSELLDIPYPYIACHFEIKHTDIAAIVFDEIEDGDFKGYARAHVITLSNDSHLYREGLPVKY